LNQPVNGKERRLALPGQTDWKSSNLKSLVLMEFGHPRAVSRETCRAETAMRRLFAISGQNPSEGSLALTMRTFSVGKD
jgi:hypothetical protein